jgi:predicted metal-dependent HD superfamily phosphohydrolase
LDEVFPVNEPNMGLIDSAFWYHDFVYDPKLHDNEVKSAFVAEDRTMRCLGLSEQNSANVGKLIRATNHKDIPKTREAEILLDMDLAILGASPEEFDLYEKGIWEEYQPHVSLEDYRHARAKVLKHFSFGHVFWSSEMRAGVYEQRAKVNIRRALRQLSPKGA